MSSRASWAGWTHLVGAYMRPRTPAASSSGVFTTNACLYVHQPESVYAWV